MDNSRNVSWRFKFHGLCHLIVKPQFNVIETNLYDWKVLDAIQQFLADPVERTVRDLKHFNYDSVAKFGIEVLGINTIILLFSDKN